VKHGRWILLAVLILTIPFSPLPAQDLGQGRLAIAGTRLVISPEAQTVPFETGTIVETRLEGYDASRGELPSGLRVVGELSGPEIAGRLTLSTLPGEPFRIPRFSEAGEYVLEDIRLVEGEELLAYGEPRSASVLVTQVLVTRVTSRALTLDEIRSYGIVVDEDSFQAYSFTFGFAIDATGETINYEVPVLIQSLGEGGDLVQILGTPKLPGLASPGEGLPAPRFRPPSLTPFTLTLDRPDAASQASGGCQNLYGDCYSDVPVRVPGVILFPTDVSLLNQFFSVVLLAKNDAPAGDPLTIRDLTARVVLPPGLRQAETIPAAPIGVPVPLHVPGPDGVLGTGDDLTFLIAQAQAELETLVEGRTEGTHIVEFQLEGVLEGLAGGRIERVSGTARGAVLVRDPKLAVTISHPDVVRNDEEYTLRLTVTNLAAAPVNSLTLSLAASGLSGVTPVGPSELSIATLLPGEAETLEFRLLSLRTGRVVASSVRSPGTITPRFELSVGVGELGIPLAPNEIVLPRSTESLPPSLIRPALSLVGLGLSAATAPASLASPERPQPSRASVDDKVHELAQAGRHVGLGEELFDAAAQVAAEWAGARSAEWEWDALRRSSQKGGQWSAALGAIFTAEATSAGASATIERFAETTAAVAPLGLVGVAGSGTRIEVTSRTTGQALSGAGDDPTRQRKLPFGDLYSLGAGQLALLARPETGGYRATIHDADGGTNEVQMVWPGATGALRATWTVTLGAGGTATAELLPGSPSATLEVDANGDGTVDDTIPATGFPLSPRPFTVLSAIQNAALDPSGHIVEVLFSSDVDLGALLPRDPQRFRLPGRVSNGGLLPTETGAAGASSRVVRVVFDNPIPPGSGLFLEISNLRSTTGAVLGSASVPVATTVIDPGTRVAGTVYGSDGQPAAFARVELYEVDPCPLCVDPCRRHRTAAVQADAAGRYQFDYVRQTACGDLFALRGTEATSGRFGTAQGRVRLIGGTQTLDVLMLGRGTVRGRITYDDGTQPADPRVVALSPVFAEGREGRIDALGNYEIRDLPVGPISLGASDRLGGVVFQTIELPRAGAVVERNLVILRRPSTRAVGSVRGIAVRGDGTTPVSAAYLALYVDGELMGVERSGLDGRFDFGTVVAGRAELEAFDGATGLGGAQLVFDVEPDRAHDVTVVLRDDRGTVTGRVLRQTLGATTPMAGVVVWVSGTPFHTVTGADGSFVLDGVFAGTRTLLAADVGAGRQSSAEVSIGAGLTVTRDLVFVDTIGGGITGQVLGFNGAPVASAAIHLATGYDTWFGEVFTDASGRFVIPDLSPGGYELHAVKGTAGAKQRVSIRFEGETPSVTLRFQRGRVKGVTRAKDGAGQWVGVSSVITYRTSVVRGGLVDLDWQERTLETAADGTFDLGEALVGPYGFTARNAFHGEISQHGTLISDGEVAEHTVDFQPNGQIHGTVLAEDGATPVAGATVRLRHPAFSAYEVTSDATGAYSFDLVPPTSQRFAIDAEIDLGTVFRQARVYLSMPRPGQELTVDIVLPRQGTVSGWVEDGSGAPVPGAVVTARELAYPQRTLVQNADSEGFFSFENVFAGRILVAAKAPALGGLGGGVQVELVAEGDEVFAFVQLEPTAEIAVRVLLPAGGGPAATTEVRLERWARGLADVATSDSEGAALFTLLPLDLYRVTAFDFATGRRGASAWVTLATGGEVLSLDVTLEARGTVDGHLREPGSLLGVPGATVQLQSVGLVIFTTYSSTDGEGFFEFGGIPQGNFRLATREPAGRRRAGGEGVLDEEGERVTVDLLLESSGRVIGTALNPAGASPGPFSPANVLLFQDGQAIGATLDNPYAFDGVIAARDFTLEAREVGGPHRGRAIGRVLEEGQELTLDVAMVPRGDVAVRVVDSFGQPVAGATVTAFAQGFYGTQHFVATSAADGYARFLGAGAGTVSASAVSLAGLRGSASGTLELEGQTAELTLLLESSGQVVGQVFQSDGTTAAVEALVVITSGVRTLQLLTDAEGRFAFPSVPLGAFKIFVQERFAPGSLERSASLATNGQVLDWGALVVDDRSPEVLALEPLAGSRDVPRTTAVSVHFSEPIDKTRYAGSWFSFYTLAGNGVGHTVTWIDGDTTAVLTPSPQLASFTGYQVTVNQAVDRAGRLLLQKVRTSFHTADTIPPAVIEIRPKHDESQVGLDAQIAVTFSEPVRIESLSGAAFQLTDVDAAAGVSTTFVLEAGERTVTLTPVGGLLSDRPYQISIQGVQDAGGNTMTGSYSATFWTLDTIAPEIVDVAFPAGTSFTAGDAIPVTVTTTDRRGIARVEISLGEWTWTDTTAPYELTAIAPVVAIAGDLPLTIRSIDRFGNVATTEWTLTIAPRVNAQAPVLAVPCGEDGIAIPGLPLELRLITTDDQSVESVTFTVAGAVVLHQAPITAASVTSSVLWTPPANAPTGASWLARLEARDFAGNVTARELTLSVPAGTILRGGRSLFDVYAGQALVLAEGEFLSRDTLQAASLVVTRGASLKPAEDRQDVSLELTGDLTLQCGGAIDASTRGYSSGAIGHADGYAPPGVTPSASGAGGSHGGRGARAGAGAIYDGVYRPELAGAGGGGATGSPKRGGGFVQATAGDLRLDGEILALGGPASCTGGSAGGTVALTAASLAGLGRIDVSSPRDLINCGINSNPFGGGAGGRVAVTVSELAGFDPRTQIASRGGYDLSREAGGPGTVYVQTATAPAGRLYLDNGVENGAAVVGPLTELPALGTGTVTTATPEGVDLWVTPATPLPRLWLGAWMALQASDGTSLGAFRVVEIDGTGRVRLAGAASTTSATSFRGEYHFDEVLVAPGAAYTASDPVVIGRLELAGSIRVPVEGLTADSIVIRSGATLVPASGSTVKLTATNLLTLEAGAKIDVTGLGYPGGTGSHPAGYAPEGVQTVPWGGSGGSHGGQGIHYTAGNPATGETYGSVYFPAFAGAGAAGGNTPGGGIVQLTAGELVLDGEILADGIGGCHGSAGGTIAVSAGLVRGSGQLRADGGSRFLCYLYNGAPGGGGRVAFDVGSFVGFDPTLQVQVRGGILPSWSYTAAPGTLFWKTAADTHGHLHIDQGAPSSTGMPATALPGIGAGVVAETLLAPEFPGTFWLRATEAAKTYGRGVAGMWVRIGSTLYRVRGESLDRKWLLVEGDPATVTAEAPFFGLYRFDSVTLTGGADALLVDTAEVGTVTADAGSSFSAIDAAVPPLAITAPAAGTSYDSGQLVSVSTALTGSRTLTRVDFRLGDQTATDATAPYTWLVPAPTVATATTFALEARAVEPNGNVWHLEVPVNVAPIPAGGLPTVGITCPTGPVVATSGMAIDLAVEASHEQGIERVELVTTNDLVTVLATDFAAPYSLRWTAPAGLVDGQVLDLVVRARTFSGAVANATVPVTIRTGAVFSTDARIAATDLSFEGQRLLVTGGTLTIDGAHDFQDLVIGSGARVSQSTWASASAPRALGINLTGDLHVACGGAFDASGKGYPGGLRPGAEPFLLWDDFNDQNLEGWQSIAVGTVNGAPNWTFSNGVVKQTTDVQGTTNGAQHPVGTVLRWTSGADWTDIRASVRMLSSDDDAVGVMFRYQDPQNHYRFYWNRQLSQRRLERVQNGVLTTLAGDAVQYTVNRWVQVELVAVGSHLEVWLDGVRVFQADDATFERGTIALLSNGNAGTQYDDVVVRPAEELSQGSAWQRLLSEDFQDNDTVGWGVTNVGTNVAPSWLVQENYYYQGAAVTSATGVGTLSRWLTGQWSDFHYSALINSIGRDDIALLFRYADSNNYYRFNWRGNAPAIRELTKRVGGQNTTLASDTVSLVGMRWYWIDVVARGSRLEVWVDHQRVFAVEDSSLSYGTVAVASNNYERRWFDDLTVDTGTAFGSGGSHGGWGGGFGASREVTGSIVDPATPGPGGGGLARSSAGGGVVRITAAGEIALDGEVSARGEVLARSTDHGAGGSIRLEAPTIRGGGLLDASGGGTPTQARAGGSGGRIALHGTSIASSLVDRARSAGGASVQSDLTGAAGTIFVLRTGDLHGELIVDNEGLISTAWTELPATASGVLELDRLTIRGLARVRTVDAVVTNEPPAVEAGAEWLPEAPADVPPVDPVVPTLALTCPSGPVLATGGLRVDLTVEASHAAGIERVDLIDAADPTVVLWTDFQAPYALEWTAPAGFSEGEVVTLVVRARSATGSVATAELPVTLRNGTVFSGDTWIGAEDLSFEGQRLFVLGGTLTIDGVHDFADLILGSGARVSQSTWATASAPAAQGITLSGDLQVGCGASFDVSAKGLPGGVRPDSEPILVWDDFNDYDLEGWQIVNPGTVEGPSAWSFPVNGVLVQVSNIWASTTTQPVGTLVYWKEGTEWRDVRASVRLLSSDDDGMGAMIRYQDPQNHYRFYWDRQTSSHLLQRVQNGVVTTLASALSPYVTGRWYALELVAQGSHLEVWIDGVRTLQANDAAFARGTLALFSNANTNTIFDDVIVRPAEVAASSSPWQRLMSEDFQDYNATGWQVTDVGPSSAGASYWTSGGLYYESRNNYSATGVGTLSRWTAGTGWTDYHVTGRLQSAGGSNGEIGLLFRYGDPDNYYRFAWGRVPSARTLSKRVGGVNTILAQDAVPYVNNTWYTVDLVARGTRLEVWIDRSFVFAVDDPSLTTGTVAVFANNNPGSFFDDIVVDTGVGLGYGFGTGGSHGGAGGGKVPPRLATGSIDDPTEPGAGGGGLARSAAGGGLVAVAASGGIVVDGQLLARGGTLAKSTGHGAGGSIRLSAPAIRGAGLVDASGGGTPTLARAGGSGGRIALVGSTVDAGLVDRAKAAGGASLRTDLTGAAGTIFVRRAGDAYGELFVDNEGLVSTAWTELPAVGTGVVDVAETARITDQDVTFPWSVIGREIRFDGTGLRWPVTGQSSDGHALDLDVSQVPLAATSGSSYQGVLALDRLTIRGSARVRTRDAVVLGTPATIENGCEWLPEAPESSPVGLFLEESASGDAGDGQGQEVDEDEEEELGREEEDEVDGKRRAGGGVVPPGTMPLARDFNPSRPSRLSLPSGLAARGGNPSTRPGRDEPGRCPNDLGAAAAPRGGRGGRGWPFCHGRLGPPDGDLSRNETASLGGVR
jgi:hypothetical protein